MLILAASRSHSATVIWLHGRDGDTAESWAVAADRLQVPWCKFMFPVSRQGWLLGETERELRQASDLVLDLVGLLACACVTVHVCVMGIYVCMCVHVHTNKDDGVFSLRVFVCMVTVSCMHMRMLVYNIHTYLHTPLPIH